MSQKPVEQGYQPAQWHSQADVESDVKVAVDNQDFRLLAFATRIAVVPGIERTQLEQYREACGLRFMKGFGDVVRSDKDIEEMKQARRYAERYNQLIMQQCSLND